MNAKKKIKELLEPKSDELKKIFELVVNNYVEHNEEFITNFLLKFLSKEFFFKNIFKRLEEKAKISLEALKSKIESDVKNIAEEIYNNLMKGIDINKLPMDEDEDEEENQDR